MVGKVTPGQNALVVEDVATTGGSVVKTLRVLREEGLTVEKVLVVVDREEGASENLKDEKIELIPLVRVSELKQKEKVE